MSSNILIVEDEHIVALDLKMSLEDLGHHVVATVAFGEQVLEKACKHQPDLVLMDIKLAGAMRGTEAARLVHQHLQLPVIFLSAFCDSTILEQAQHSLPYGCGQRCPGSRSPMTCNVRPFAAGYACRRCR